MPVIRVLGALPRAVVPEPGEFVLIWILRKPNVVYGVLDYPPPLPKHPPHVQAPRDGAETPHMSHFSHFHLDFQVAQATSGCQLPGVLSQGRGGCAVSWGFQLFAPLVWQNPKFGPYFDPLEDFGSHGVSHMGLAPSSHHSLPPPRSSSSAR